MVSNRSEDYVNQQFRLIRTYPLKFFGDRRIDDLRKGDFSDYWMWRRENSAKVNPMTDKSPPYIPSNNSLRRESVALRNLFAYAVDKEWVPSIPEMNIPPLVKNRRPTFTVGVTSELPSCSDPIARVSKASIFLYSLT